jgi:hypothetical protein
MVTSAKRLSAISLLTTQSDSKSRRGCVLAAANIRRLLKIAYPSVKFSVKTSKYAGGNSISVSWENGPPIKEVGALVGRFEGCGFDGSQDMKTYHADPTGFRSDFGGSDYVFASRGVSDSVRSEVGRLIDGRLGDSYGAPGSWERLRELERLVDETLSAADVPSDFNSISVKFDGRSGQPTFRVLFS